MWSEVESKHQTKRTGLHDWAEDISVRTMLSWWGSVLMERVFRTPTASQCPGKVWRPLWPALLEFSEDARRNSLH